MSKRTLTTVFLVSVILPVAVYFRVWDYYAINIPKWDDHVLKKFLDDFLHAGSLSEKWAALSRQHNEHRILLTRLLAWMDYSFFGHLNYKRLMFYGNVLFVSLLILWAVVLLKNKKPLFTLIPIAFVWPTLAHWENMYWGMAAVQNFGVVTLSVLAIYWSVRGRGGYFVLGVIAAGLAAFSSGNGLLVLPVILVMIFLRGQPGRGLIWIGMTGLFIFLYFNGYRQPDYNPESKASVIELIQGYMAFIGSFAEVFPVQGKREICIILGAVLFLVALSIIWAIVFRLIRKRYEYEYARVTDLFTLGVILFILGTAAMVVYSRAGFGADTLITSRYKIYSFLLLVTAYLFIVIPIRGTFLSPYVSGVAFLTILLNIFAYHFYLVDAYNLRKFLTASHFNQVYVSKDLKPFIDTTAVGKIVERPTLFYDRWTPLIKVADLFDIAGTEDGIMKISRETTLSEQSGKMLEIRNDSYKSQRLQDSGIYIILSSSKRYYLFPTYRTNNRNKKQLLFRQQYFAPGFEAHIPLDNNDEIEAGHYRIGMVLQKGDSTGIFMRSDSVIVQKTKEAERRKIKTNW